LSEEKEGWVSLREAAKHMGCSSKTLAMKIRGGEIPAHGVAKLKTHWRVKLSVLEGALLIKRRKR
jgi:excisionase family DNA binding protein